MTNVVRFRGHPAAPPIEALIARHGALPVLRAALGALLRPRPRPPEVGTLPAHLRRDLGLGEGRPRPPPALPRPPW
ncbi:MAG: hypothetical protein ACU0BS_07735 [Hasllibacter sp.]